MTDPSPSSTLRNWIGREETVSDVLTESLAQRFHATLGLPGRAATEGEAAPRLIHFCLCQAAAPTSDLGLDGHPPRGGFLPPVQLPRRMWAAGALKFSGDLLVGETVTRHSRIADVVIKEGRSGQLCFVEVAHELSASGQLRIAEQQTIVYRDAAVAPAVKDGPSAPPAPEGERRHAVHADSRLLFRYSALTFNSHRIHYDLPYTTEVEAYPALVVHGPLQASLLYHFASGQADSAPDEFSFRSQAPLFDREPVVLNSRWLDGGGIDLWTAAPDGPYGMRASAWWK